MSIVETTRRFLFALISVALAAGAEATPLDVSWTDQPPVLDGNLDDACWQNAAVARDFVLLPKGSPTQQTEVRFTYDARCLYVCWRLYESPPAALAGITPEPGRDRLDRKEAAEVMLFPDPKKPDWRMLIGAPSGWRCDIASGVGAAFDPDWQCVAGRFDQGWTLEEQIPFGELAGAGQLIATPQPGDTWRLQLYRKKADPREVSAWYDESAEQRQLRFVGPPGGPAQRITARLPFQEWAGTLALTVTGATAPFDGHCRILQSGRVVATLVASGTQDIELPFRLPEGGEVRFQFELTQQGRVVYSGQAATSLPALAGVLREIEQELRVAPGAMRQRVREFAEKLRRVKRELTGVEQLLAEWKPLQRDLNLTRLQSSASTRFVVGAVTESDKIYRDTLYRGSLTDPIQLALAGNEYGSFQLVVIPLGQELKDVTVSFSELRGPRGQVIPQENFQWFRVGYVKLEDPPGWANVKYDHSHEPDPLLPAAPLDVPAGEVAAVWVDLRLPSGTPAGTYAGTVTVTAGGQRVSRPVRVRAHGFAIPERSSIPVEAWFTPGYGWYPFYGAYPYTPALYAKQARVLGRYRIGSFPSDMALLCAQVPIHQEANGQFTFDWTTFDKYVRIALDNGTQNFWCSLSCNSGWTYYLNTPGTPVIERASGAHKTIADYMQAKWTAAGETNELGRLYGKAQFENPVYRDFLVAYVQHLKELGINNQSYYELFDEANQDATPQRWLDMIEHHRFFRKLVPDLRLFNFGFTPTIEIAGQNALGLIDTWAPHLLAFDPQADIPDTWHYRPPVYDALLERRAKHGEKFWFYTCAEFQDKQNNYTPYLLYHRPNIQLRLHGWMAWRYQVDGFFVYALSHVPLPNRGKKAEDRWPNSEWSDGGDMGCGTLLYPGPHHEVIPSMRLSSVRRGLEDYEYFALLRREAAQLSSTRDRDLLRQITRALQIEGDIISSVYQWTKNRNRLETKREELAALIKKVRRAQPTAPNIPTQPPR